MTANKNCVADLFQEKPRQWGLRGDPYLWQEMTDHFATTPLPDSPAQLAQLLAQAFETSAGQPITAEEHFFVERFAHGGMSSGLVSPEFWRGTAVPLLLSRFEKIA